MSSGIHQLERKIDPLPPPSVWVWNEWIYTSAFIYFVSVLLKHKVSNLYQNRSVESVHKLSADMSTRISLEIVCFYLTVCVHSSNVTDLKPVDMCALCGWLIVVRCHGKASTVQICSGTAAANDECVKKPSCCILNTILEFIWKD